MDLDALSQVTPEPTQQEVAPSQETVAPEVDSQPTETPTESQPKADPIQKRINQITAQRHAAERQATEYARQLSEAQAAYQQMEAQVRLLQQQASLPDPSQFGSPEEYSRHVQEQLRQSAAQQFQQQQQAFQQQRNAQLQYQWHNEVVSAAQNVIAQGSAKYQDFEAVVGNEKLPGLMGQHPEVVRQLLGSESSADVLYFLGKNPTEAYRIASLPVAAQIKEIGRIEARVSTRQTAHPPSPLAPVPGGSTTTQGLSRSLPTEEWAKRFLKSYSNRN